MPIKESRCETQEMTSSFFGTIIGLDSDIRANSIMWKRFDDTCSKKFLPEFKESISKLYKNVKPDLGFENATALVDGDSTTFEITITNYGLQKSQPVALTVYDGDYVTKLTDIPVLYPNQSFTYSSDPVRLILKKKHIDVYIDRENKQDELNKEDNHITLVTDYSESQ